jgi:hypothetical protein
VIGDKRLHHCLRRLGIEGGSLVYLPRLGAAAMRESVNPELSRGKRLDEPLEDALIGSFAASDP